MPSPSGYEHILGVTVEFEIVQLKATAFPSLTIIGRHKLPLSYTPRFILPVDPMAWGHVQDWASHDNLLSISEDGELAFWVPEGNPENGWKCSGKVRTGRSGFRKVRCSSAKKTVLSKIPSLKTIELVLMLTYEIVVDSPEGNELTIWDSTESEFASGLEHHGTYRYFVICRAYNDIKVTNLIVNLFLTLTGALHATCSQSLRWDMHIGLTYYVSSG